MTEKDLRQCKYCPKLIKWAVSAGKGAAVPLDPKPVKVWILDTDPGRADPREPRVRIVWGWTPHHATCAGVDQARADVNAKRDKARSAGRRSH